MCTSRWSPAPCGSGGYFAETFVDEAERARAAEFIKSAPALTEQVVTLLRTEDILKLPLTIIFYIYACHRKDLHLLSHFVRLTLSYCGILCSIR